MHRDAYLFSREYDSTVKQKTCQRLLPDIGLRVREVLKLNGGSEWESNPPATSEMPPAGFEDRGDHRTACASV
jgi:hypothetical protein